MLAGDNNGLWREFFEISFEISIVLFESITKTLYHARNTLLTVCIKALSWFFLPNGLHVSRRMGKKIPNINSACKR